MKINAYGTNAPENFTIDKPDNIQEMFEYAEKLSTPFPFVRVDFYNVDGKQYTVFTDYGTNVIPKDNSTKTIKYINL